MSYLDPPRMHFSGQFWTKMINTDMQGASRRPTDFDVMYARFGIDAPKWSQISTHWVDKLTKDPQLGADYGQKVRARVKELDNAYKQQTGAA